MFRTLVKDFSYRNRHFTLGKIAEGYVAIEDKYIDAEGKLNQKLNGLQMYLSRKSLDDCMKKVKDQVEVDHLVHDLGYEPLEAIRQVLM